MPSAGRIEVVLGKGSKSRQAVAPNPGRQLHQDLLQLLWRTPYADPQPLAQGSLRQVEGAGARPPACLLHFMCALHVQGHVRAAPQGCLTRRRRVLRPANAWCPLHLPGTHLPLPCTTADILNPEQLQGVRPL